MRTSVVGGPQKFAGPCGGAPADARYVERVGTFARTRVSSAALASAALASVAFASVALAACTPTQQYTYRDGNGGPERRLPETHARVVTRAQAEAAGTPGTPLAVPFGPDGDATALVADFLVRADEAEAAMVS